jgi:hypothetical protein
MSELPATRRIAKPLGVYILTAIDFFVIGLLPLLAIVLVARSSETDIPFAAIVISVGLAVLVMAATGWAWVGDNAGRWFLLITVTISCLLVIGNGLLFISGGERSGVAKIPNFAPMIRATFWLVINWWYFNRRSTVAYFKQPDSPPQARSNTSQRSEDSIRLKLPIEGVARFEYSPWQFEGHGKGVKLMRTKLWIVGAALSLFVAVPASALKVHKVTSEGTADVKVYVAGSKGSADCIIYIAPSEGVANGNAKWYYESSAGVADVSMYFTDSAGLADKAIFFTTSEGLARCDVDWKSYKKDQLGSAPRADGVGAQLVQQAASLLKGSLTRTLVENRGGLHIAQYSAQLDDKTLEALGRARLVTTPKRPKVWASLTGALCGTLRPKLFPLT